MVILKKVVLIFVFIFVSSCCDMRLIQEGGLRSKRYYKKYLKKRVSPSIVGIDTAVLYKSMGYMHKESNNNIIELVTDPITLDEKGYFKFYSNGNFYHFIKHDSVSLNKNLFNPKKGNINFLIKNRKESVFTDYSPLECGSFGKNNFEVKGDTLIVSAGSNIGHRIWYYYKKQKIPKSWLTFTPDE